MKVTVEKRRFSIKAAIVSIWWSITGSVICIFAMQQAAGMAAIDGPTAFHVQVARIILMYWGIGTFGYCMYRAFTQK